MFISEARDAIAIRIMPKSEIENKISSEDAVGKSASFFSYRPSALSVLRILNSEMELDSVIACLPETTERDPKWALELGGNLAKELKAGSFYFDWDGSEELKKQIAIGWGMSQYDFDLFLSKNEERFIPELVVEDLEEELQDEMESIYLARDLVNTPANHMNPDHLEKVVRELGEEFNAKVNVIKGEELVKENFPAIYEVGKGSTIAPRLIELNWGDDKHPVLSLVGKGVCFDAGGYDIKPSKGMRKMKKDMGGAAISIALAKLVMKNKLPVRLQLLVPAVENLVSGSAFKPGDVISTRKGSSIEIDNTDAEGRLVLCDALTYATEKSPDFILDFATLTGACRVALGQDLPGLYSDRPDLAREIQDLSFEQGDPVWAMPLYLPYKKMLSSTVADLQNSASSGFGGSITAALYLHHFVESANTDWVHIDVYAWSDESRSYLNRGAETQGLRSLFAYLKMRYDR